MCPVNLAHLPRIRDKGPEDYKVLENHFFFFPHRGRNCGEDGVEPGPEQLLEGEKTTCEKAFMDNSIEETILSPQAESLSFYSKSK